MYNLALITAGTIIWVVGMNSILVPNHFLGGGLVGIALLLHYLFPVLDIGWSLFALNIPLFILGWHNISRRFMIYSLYGMGTFSLAASILKPPAIEINDPILSALFAGIICGAGGGIVLRSRGSGGGLDILSVYLRKGFGIQIGTTVFAFNAMVLMGGVYFYSLQKALYSLIFLFTAGKVINAVLTGFNQKKSLMIISEHTDAITEELLCNEKRGITLLDGEGGFTHRKKKIIITISSQIELPKIKEIILKLDPDAFIVVTDTSEVLGKRYSMGCVY
jgi:uncharacterized membrane-anchored protein YitT (DUF2179 family)